MIILLFLHNCFQSLLRHIVPFPEILGKLVLPPVSKGTAMMLILLGSSSSNDIPAILWSFVLFVAHQSVGMFDIVHMRLEVRCRYLASKVLIEILFIVLHAHSASL